MQNKGIIDKVDLDLYNHLGSTGNYTKLIGSVDETYNGRYIRAVAMQRHDGSFAVLNYHPLRKGLAEVKNTTLETWMDDVQSSIKSLRRLVDMLDS